MSFSLAGARAQSSSQTAEQQLVAGNKDFAFRLLKQLAREQNRANIFISPYSIASVLEMISNGARGRTQEELQQVLGIAGMSAASMNSAYEAVSQSISRAQTNAVLNIANAVWYRNEAQLNPDFNADNERFYHAELGAVDFADPGTVQKMNRWAAENTLDRIQTIVQPPIPPNTMMVLANAIYFKGTWLDPFDPKLTKDGTFYQATGRQQSTPMMQQTRSFLYEEGSGFQGIKLPYSGRRLDMAILLPETNSTLGALLGRLEGSSWQNATQLGFRFRRGTLVLPRFKLHYGTELNKPLAAMGARSAFSTSADFSGMSAKPLVVSKVEHQTFVEVNEEGTEAAAATTGMVALASVQHEPPPFQMIVDRPFLFLISDVETRAILFMGLVFDPSSS